MDDDLQHDPEDIPRLYRKIIEGYDICYANYRKKRQKLYKNFGSYLAGKVARWVLSKPDDIYMSPFKIIRREVTDRIVAYKGPFPFIDGLIFQITDNITQITVEHHRRYAGESTHNIWKQIPVFLTLTTNYSILPLRAMTIFGFICSLISFFLGIYFLCVYFWVGVKVYGWTALALINLFIGGTVLMSLGFIGEYIGRVLMNVNGVPQYVVEETVNTVMDKDETGV
jgi:undecaprenyl-phosphate 4-deoxy-4-formamido-L-arabinose transferase